MKFDFNVSNLSIWIDFLHQLILNKLKPESKIINVTKSVSESLQLYVYLTKPRDKMREFKRLIPIILNEM